MKKLLALIVMLLAVVPVAMAEDPLEVYSITDIDITTVRSDYEYGWEIIAGTNDTAWYVYGKTNDSADVFIPDWYTDTSYLSVIINGIEQTPAVTAGDTVTFTYLTESGGGEQDVIVRCPAIAVDDYRFYVGTTGSAFSDAACLVKISDVTPTPSVTPTAAATATAVIPTATPSLTPAASATPTPVTADIWYQVGVSIYPATGGSDVALSGDLSVQSDITATNLTASMPVVTDASKNLASGAGYWTTFTTDAGSTVANSATDELGIVGGGIATTSITADVVTVTATEAQTLWATMTSDAGSTTANSLTDELSIVGAGIATTAVTADVLTVTATEAQTLSAVCTLGASYAGTVTVETSIVELPTSAGTATAYTVDYTSDASTLTAGLTASFIAHTTNTGAATLAIDSLAAKDIFNSNDALAAGTGDVIENAVITVIYDGTQYQIISGNNSN